MVAHSNSSNHLISVGRFQGKSGVSFHSHAGTELVLVKRGACTIDVGAVHLSGGRNSLFILPPNVAHNQVNHEFIETLYVDIVASPAVLDPRARVLDLSQDREHFITRWMDDLYEANVRVLEGFSDLASGIGASLLCRVGQIERHTQTLTGAHPAVARAIGYIEQNLSSPLTVLRIAEAAQVSCGYLTACFTKELKVSPLHYALSRRMEFAKRLLQNEYLTISEVGYQCGYEDQNYFARIFKKLTGMTPGEFRKQK